MTIENFNKTVKKLLPMIFVCTIGIGLVSIPSAHAVSCLQIAHPASFDVNSDTRGSHIKLHIFKAGENTDIGRSALNKSMYKNTSDWETVLEAYGNSGMNFKECPGRSNPGEKITDFYIGYNLQETIEGAYCTAVNAQRLCKTLGDSFTPNHYRFVYRYIEGQWVLNTAFPSE